MIIAQLTDCHILRRGRLLFGRMDTAARLADAVTWLNGLAPRPDAVLLTGDLVDEADPAAYDRLSEILAPLAAPVYPIPGNHDDRTLFRRTFGGLGLLPAEGDCAYAVEHFPVRLIGLDTVVDGAPHGALTPERAAWLDQTLAARPGVPTILFMHHPPFLTGVEALDLIACRGADRLAALIDRHPQIEAILCGHHHQAISLRWRGVTAMVAPPTAQVQVVDLAGDRPPRWVDEPAHAALHVWRRGAGLVSRTVCVQRTGGPFAYLRRWAPLSETSIGRM